MKVYLLEFFNEEGESLDYYLDDNNFFKITDDLWSARRFSKNDLKNFRIPKARGFQKLFIKPTEHWFSYS